MRGTAVLADAKSAISSIWLLLTTVRGGGDDLCIEVVLLSCDTDDHKLEAIPTGGDKGVRLVEPNRNSVSFVDGRGLRADLDRAAAVEDVVNLFNAHMAVQAIGSAGRMKRWST